MKRVQIIIAFGLTQEEASAAYYTLLQRWGAHQITTNHNNQKQLHNEKSII